MSNDGVALGIPTAEGVHEQALASFERASRLRLWSSRLAQALVVLVFLISAFGSMSVGFGAGLLSGLFSGSGASGPRLVIYPLLGYLAFFVLPVVVALPIYLPFALFWREPRCIVVFRRFNVGHHGPPLQRVLTKYLTPHGHVFTLADSSIHLSWIVRIPIVLGQLGFVHFRPRKIESEAQLQTLRRLLDQRPWLNVNWIVSFRKLFSISASDAHWQACVAALLERADMVVIDISSPRDTVRWEMGEAIDRGLADRMVFLSNASNEDLARGWLEQLRGDFPALSAIPLMIYDQRGPRDPGVLERSLVERLAVPQRPSKPPYAALLLRIASTIAFSTAVALAGCVVAAPYLFGAFVAQHSPWEWHIHQTYLYSSDSQAALERLARDFPATTTPALISYAKSTSEHRREKGFDGLAAVGDTRAVPFLVEVADAEAYREAPALITLRALLKRDASATSAYIAALRTTRQMPFDRELHQTIAPALAGVGVEVFAGMLESRSEASRFTAALRLATENDLSVVKTLLELSRWTEEATTFSFAKGFERGPTRHFESQVRWDIERLVESGAGALDTLALAPYIGDRSDLAVSVAKLAIKHGKPVELVALMGAEPMPKALLSVLADRATPSEPSRERDVLVALPREHLQGLLDDDEKQVRLEAALALALQGDASGLGPTLGLMEEQGTCDVFLGLGSQPCFVHHARGSRVIDALAATLEPTGSFPVPLADLDRIAVEGVIRLTAAVDKSGDEKALHAIIKSYARHPGAQTEPRMFGGVVDDMAKAIPERSHRWVIRAAFAEPQGHARMALHTLGRTIVSQHCPAFYFHDADLAERAKDCQALPK